jgi:hypothetical protein
MRRKAIDMRLRPVVFTAFFSLCVGGLVGSATAQVAYFFVPTGPANYDDDDNWLEPNLLNMFRPEASIGETATVDNGGTATVTSTPPAPGGLSIGSTRAGVSGIGTVEVGSGGNLSVNTGPNVTGNVSVGVAGTGTLRVLRGGTLVAAGGLTTGVNANDLIVAGGTTGTGTAALTASVMALNGTTQVYPTANVTTSGNGNVVFGSTSIYQSEVNTGGTGRITAGGAGILNGTAHLNFTGVSPTVGSTWTVLEADTFSGSFTQVTSSVATPFNQKFVPTTVTSSPGRQQVRMKLEEVLVLEVNRDNGMVTMTHPGASAITLDSYFIGSTAGSLLPGNFNGIDDQNLLGGNWLETSLTANNVAELKPNLNGSYGAGIDIELGNIFNPYAGGFGGASEEDLQFVTSRFTDEAQISAIVKYSGTKVNNLLLQVDPTGVGDSFLRNTSQTSVQLDVYQVQSAMGRLSPTNWNSLDEQNVDGNGTWLEALNNTANQVAEFNASFTTPYLTLDPGEMYNLGKVYTGGAQDLVFQFQMAGQPTLTQGVVIYEEFVPSVGLDGDYNDDGVVDAVDYTVWRNNLNDPNEDDINNNGDGGGVGPSDYTFWKQNYGNTAPGAGSGGLGGAASVPEPSGLLLLVVAIVGLGADSRGWGV